MNDEDLVTVPGEGEERIAIERHEAAKIEDALLHAVPCESLRDPHSHVHVRAVGDDRKIAARPPKRRSTRQAGARDRVGRLERAEKRKGVVLGDKSAEVARNPGQFLNVARSGHTLFCREYGARAMVPGWHSPL